MNRTYALLFACIIGIAVVLAECTTLPASDGTPPPTTAQVTPTVPATQGQTPPTVIPTTADTGTTNPPATLPTGVTLTPTTAPGGPVERVKITAKNFAFDRQSITVPAGSQVVIEFENRDQAPHNVAFYTSPSLATTIYKGEIITGPRTVTYTFAAPGTPGSYYFRCDIHPSMDGQFIVT